MDLYHTNDQGENINISKAMRDMNEKIMRCLERVMRGRSTGSLIKVDNET